MADPPGDGAPDHDHAVYGISVAAELTGTGVQNLRAWERAGLVDPERTEGGTRRYSHNDIVRLRRIALLLDQGLNLAGIAMVLELQDQIAERDEAPRTSPKRRRPAMSATPAESAPGSAAPDGQAPDDVAEADWAEQHTAADPETDELLAEGALTVHSATTEADPADLAEQDRVAFVDDDEL